MHIFLILILQVFLVGACAPETPDESPTETVKNRLQETGTNTSLSEENPRETAALPAPSVANTDHAFEVAGTLVIIPLTPEAIEEPYVMDKTTSPTPGDQQADNIYVVQAKEDLAKRLNVSKDQIALVKFKSVVWPDGSYGCPQPGIIYTQVQREGYFIRLGYAGDFFDYHGGGGTPPFLCEVLLIC